MRHISTEHRMTRCLAHTLRGPCARCGAQFVTSRDVVLLVGYFVHNKNCTGCMAQIPNFCKNCRKTFSCE